MPSSLVSGLVRDLMNIGKKLIIRKGAVIVFESGITADPANPVKGTVYFNSSTNVLRLYNGSAWVNL